MAFDSLLPGIERLLLVPADTMGASFLWLYRKETKKQKKRDAFPPIGSRRRPNGAVWPFYILDFI